MLGGEESSLRLALLSGQSFHCEFAGAQFTGDGFKFGLDRASALLEMRDSRRDGAQLTLHSQWAGFIGAAAGHHAALIAGAIGRNEGVLRKFAGKSFRSLVARQIGSSQAREELLGCRPERIAELDKLIQTGNDAVFGTEMRDRFVFIQLQVAERIDEEGGASANFVPKHADPGARVVVGFNDDVFELFTQVLLDCGFVLFLDVGIICEHTDGTKFLAAVAFVGGEKLLNGLAGVGVIVQDLRQRGLASANPSKRIAEGISFLRGFLALLPKFHHARVQFSDPLLQQSCAAHSAASRMRTEDSSNSVSRDSCLRRNSVWWRRASSACFCSP